MNRGGRTEEKRVCVSQKGLKKRDRFRDRNLLRFIRHPHYVNCVSVLRQELFTAVELNAGVSQDRKRVISNLEKCFFKPITRDD